jgi:hypothetical protein
VQTSAEGEAGPADDPAEMGAAVGDGGAIVFQHDEVARAREQIMMLVVGFGTGLTIGVVFLSYIVLEKLNLF